MKPKWLYIHIPKCAGMSIKTSLGNLLVSGAHHDTLIEILNKRKMSITDFNKVFSFTIIRNPWDRMVSWYECWGLSSDSRRHWPEKNKKYKSFNHWIQSGAPFYWDRQENNTEYKPWINQCSFYANGQITLTKIYKMHTLKEFWPEICNYTIGKQVKLLHKNSREHKPYQEYYTDTTKKMVANLCSKDICLHNWNFEDS